MQGIQSLQSPFNPPLTLQGAPEALRIRPEPGTVDRNPLRVTVANKHAFPVTELYHDIAAQNGIESPSVSIGSLEYADYVSPPVHVRIVSLYAFPDLPDNTYSPELAENINRTVQQIEVQLQRRGIANLGPVE